MTGLQPFVDPASTPGWLRPLVSAAEELAWTFHQFQSPGPDARTASVLILFGGWHWDDADVLLTRRSAALRQHAGQVAFPGGGTEPQDTDEVHTALREASEETGLDPAGVQPLAILPPMFLPPSSFLVTPVLAHWPRPSAVAPVDPGETDAVVRVPINALVDPANRVNLRGPTGVVSPAFLVAGMVVWGFTGGVLANLLSVAGWARPWDASAVVDLDTAHAVAHERHRAASREEAG